MSGVCELSNVFVARRGAVGGPLVVELEGLRPLRRPAAVSRSTEGLGGVCSGAETEFSRPLGNACLPYAVLLTSSTAACQHSRLRQQRSRMPRTL